MEIKTTKCIVMSRVSTTIQDLDVQEEECIQMAMRDGYSQENMILIPRVGESARKVGEIIKNERRQGTNHTGQRPRLDNFSSIVYSLKMLAISFQAINHAIV